MQLNFLNNGTDSNLLGLPVYDIEMAPHIIALHAEIESTIAGLTFPCLLNAYINIDDLNSISVFTDLQFQFIECRLHVLKELQEKFHSIVLFPFVFNRINEVSDLADLIRQCEGMNFDDRYSCDHHIDREVALNRNIFFLRQSFIRDNEPIFVLKNQFDNSVLGFRSFRLDSEIEASMLLCGVNKSINEEKYLKMISLFELEVLSNLGIRYISAVLSARNSGEINRYIADHGYTIEKIQYVCRRICQ